jgi:predicted nucleic acid-binding protein
MRQGEVPPDVPPADPSVELQALDALSRRVDRLVYVLDTSAIFCQLNDESGADQVDAVLEAARGPAPSAEVLIPFMALMELHYLLLRVHTPEMAREVLNRVQLWPVSVPESDPVWRVRAAEIKARGNLSVADAWIAGLAAVRGAQLVHKDPEFDVLSTPAQLRLPS